MIGLDTHVLLRYFAQDDARQSALANRLIDTGLSPSRQAHVSLVTLAELVWVLRSRYRATLGFVSDALAHLLADRRFVVQDRNAVWAALDLYRRGKTDYADALMATLDRTHGCTHTFTFDKKAAQHAGMSLLE